MKIVLLLVAAVAVASPLACTSTPDGTGTTDAVDAGPTSQTDAAARDASADAPADAAETPCTGACAATSLTAKFGGKSAPLDRAQLGTETSRDGAPLLHVEAHSGGDPACPHQNSPVPDRTMIVSNLPRGSVGDVFTNAQGVGAVLLDFDGSLGLPPTTSATSVEVTITAIDAADPPVFVALDVTANFPGGTVIGHAYATYCASLSR